MGKSVLLWAILGLVFPASVLAAQPLSPQMVEKKGWFSGLTREQKLWLFWAVDKGYHTPPTQEYFIRLGPSLRLYPSPSSEKAVAEFQDLPCLRKKGKECWSKVKIEILGFQNGRIQVRLSGQEGWIERSSVKLDSLAVLDTGGRYIRDLFPNFWAGGSRQRPVLQIQEGKCYLVLRFINTYRGDQEKFFGFELDLNTWQIVDVVPWQGNRKTAKALAEVLDQEALQRAATGLGFENKTSRHKGKLIIHRYSLSPNSPAIIAGNYVLVLSRR